MTTYNWTSQTLQAPTECRVEFISNAFPLTSPLSQAVQVVNRPGDHIRMTYVWENLYGGARADVLAFFARLNGPEHRCLLPLFGQTQRGALSGSPLVNGANQTGNTLAIDGVGSVSNWGRAGDWIEVEDHLHMLTDDVSSSGGAANLPVQPSLRSPANNATVQVSTATMLGQFILVSPVSVLNNARSQLFGGGAVQNNLTLEFVEDVVA